MKWHPFTEQLPLLEGEEWISFKASIKETGGNKVPVVFRTVNGEREGIDGRNRFYACEELGLQCRMEEEILEDDEVRDFILVRNIHRRHMTPALRRQIVAKLRGDGQSMRQIAETLGVGQSTVVRDLANIPQPEFVTGRDGKAYPATRSPSAVGSIPEVEAIATAYIRARDTRIAMLRQEVDCHDQLLKTMAEHALQTYTFNHRLIWFPSPNKVRVSRIDDETDQESVTPEETDEPHPQT